MERWTRRRLLLAGAALGATVVFASYRAVRSRLRWQERRDLSPEGVASGDPTADGVVLWTRRPFAARAEATLGFEVSEDAAFRRVIAGGNTTVAADADWTCRVLVSGLRPAQVYWYRFADESGFGSRIGRTSTAPADDDPRPVRFAFVSCQNANLGTQNAYRRMIFEDERAPEAERLGFVLHLGDFVYELVWYPEDRPKGMYDRRIRDLVRYANGEKIDDFHMPTTVDDYRAVYRAYLRDPDLQDARARWPFVAMWDNHEFSWLGWQAMQVFGGKTRPAQTRKVAANQAWFEYHPARIGRPGQAPLARFVPPPVSDVTVDRFDDDGLGIEPNNLAAIGSLTGYRTLRWGRNVELVVTDHHSYRSEDPAGRPEIAALASADFPEMLPEEVWRMLDAGRRHDEGRPPESIRFDGKEVPNFRRNAPPQTILGSAQKKWFLERLATSSATWKIWGSTQGTLDWRVDPQNLPPGLTRPWPGAGYASLAGGDHGTAYTERAEIYDFVRDHRIAGFATIAGDRHSFWAGFAAKELPPRPFEPVGIAFVTGSISAPGIVEALEHGLSAQHPLRALYLADLAGKPKPDPTINMAMLHGVRACLEYARSGDVQLARSLSNPDLSPHLRFLDMGGHGYATVRATSESFEVEFVAIPRPLEPASREDGGPIVYRVMHRSRLWTPGVRPQLERCIVEGDPALSI